jgi:hypothetical protein
MAHVKERQVFQAEEAAKTAPKVSFAPAAPAAPAVPAGAPAGGEAK